MPSLWDYIIEIEKNLPPFAWATYDYVDSYLAQSAADMIWFYNQVKPSGPWDLKYGPSWKAAFGEDTFYGPTFNIVYEDTIITPEMLGNITYGYWGSAMGYSDELLYFGVGVANNTWKVWKLLDEYYGETEEDHNAIKRGIEYYHNTH